MKPFPLLLGLSLLLLALATTLATAPPTPRNSDTPAPPSSPSTAPATSPAATTPADPKTTFYGTDGNATRVVYIIDHSGSTLDNFDFLREELKRSVNNLTPLQFFNVVMVSEEVHTVLPSGKLARASAENKKDFANKIADYRAQGMNEDLLEPFQQAFEEAFKSNPQLIFFITDAHLDPKLLAIIDTLNPDRKTRINTLAFVNMEPGYEDQLQSIAKKNGGVYKFITEKDLGR